MQKIDTVLAMKDVEKRAAAAAALTREAQTRATAAGALRNLAIQHASRIPNVVFARIYKTIGVSRSLYLRKVEEAPAVLAPLEGDPIAIATKAQKDWRKYHDIEKRAMALRNADIHRLLTYMSNADVATLTGLTTARIAQLRTGERVSA